MVREAPGGGRPVRLAPGGGRLQGLPTTLVKGGNVQQGSQAEFARDRSEIDNIVLARTSDILVRARFSSIKVHIKLDLRSYYAIRASASVRLPKHRFELKGPILGLKHPGNRCTWALRHNFCCRGPILIPRPVLESPA